MSMYAQRCSGGGARRSERSRTVADDNRYAETDPTGRYGRFNEVLGKGAMKTVYRAFDELNGIEVAWNQAKLCDVLRSPDMLQRMYSEVNLLSNLRHESIIRFHASWVDVGRRTFNFITEMFTSGTLREYRSKYPHVNIRAVKNWARQILSGLVYLHSQETPVIHRDLKCDNIFVNGHLGQVKIGDLGLATVLKGSQSAHSVIGTPEFMAPELYEEEYNELVDIYSFGMCMLEILTAEYPYSECTNPAQIYKKVTCGKLPNAFHKIEDSETRNFIGRCLLAASKRPSAKELLLDPFLLDDHTISVSSNMTTESTKAASLDERYSDVPLPDIPEPENTRTDMTITGKLNPVDDTIFLKVRIGDETVGQLRNIYFPYNITRDTPIDVAKEMVKELEISDWEPSEIAEIIAQEISTLVPEWINEEGGDQEHNEYTYEDDDDYGGENPPGFYYLSSSPSSSQGSICGLRPPSQGFSAQNGMTCLEGNWFQDYPFTDDDDSSTNSGKYSATTYYSGNEAQPEPSTQCEQPSVQPVSNSTHKSTRFCNANPRVTNSLACEFDKQCQLLHRPFDDHPRRMMKNRSMVNVRSQLLHRTVGEYWNQRLFNTVGAVENIGFHVPCNSTRRMACQSPHGGDRRKLKQKCRE